MNAYEAMYEKPKWEHGYRGHGFWLSPVQRFGCVNLPPACARLFNTYYWYTNLPNMEAEKGTETSLRVAKRKVEQAYKRWSELPENQKGLMPRSAYTENAL